MVKLIYIYIYICSIHRQNIASFIVYNEISMSLVLKEKQIVLTYIKELNENMLVKRPLGCAK